METTPSMREIWDLEGRAPIVAESTTQSQLKKRGLVTPDQVTIVIPTLNEREAIGKVLDDLKSEGFEKVLVVDGYSDDGTTEIAESKGAVVLNQHGPGKAGALATAARAVSTPFMLVMDGDDTYKAADIHRLLANAADHDEVIGARTIGRKNIPLKNRFGNWVISRAFKSLFTRPITDVLSGMYLLRTDMMRELEITSSSFDVEVEIASHMASMGDITQVPITYGERLGKQKLRASDGTRILSTLFWMAYYYNPVLVLGGLAALAAIPASAVILWTIYEQLFHHIWHSAYALFGVMLFLIAAQALAVSLGSVLTKRSEQRIMRELRKNSR